MSAIARYQASTVETLFKTCFADENVILRNGGDEPLYIPSQNGEPAQLCYAHGYFASCLHEIAHWCIAGRRRLQLVDFGYWYCPDGRDAKQQAEFEQVESKPQAVEWSFHLAAGSQFNISSDNLNGVSTDDRPFRQAVLDAAQRYVGHGFPPRALRFQQALAHHFDGQATFAPDDFPAAALGL